MALIVAKVAGRPKLKKRHHKQKLFWMTRAMRIPRR
jgi:hypothetical protein